jgi:acyl-coenzyme A thioesterase PaaI-like protein
MSQDASNLANAMKQAVPYVKTTGIDFEEASQSRVVATLPDDETLHNHIGGPHAAMMFGLGESASGAVVMAAFAAHLGKATPLAVSAEISYKKIAMGPLRAEAVLGRSADEVLAELESGTRPEFPVTITITNAEGVTTGEMTVVWTLKPAR